MAKRIAELISSLEVDPWRKEVGFSDNLRQTQEALFLAKSEADAILELEGWLQKFQPCLFGRIAAKQGLLSHCVLDEDTLVKSDEAVQDTIARARTKWTKDGYTGKKSGFIISLISPAIASAKPGPTMMALAQRIAALYLQRDDKDVNVDEVIHDEMFLEIPDDEHSTLKWLAGINYFSAQADKRWWQDHRYPGGMAFSTNSVGHMAKSGQRQRAITKMHDALDIESDDPNNQKVDSLETALNLAMKTIQNASDHKSGKATTLMSMPDDKTLMPAQSCPYKLSPSLNDKNFCEYQGYYHTDYSIPSEYFREDIERPVDVKLHTLDFTYLFMPGINNPAFVTMGIGRQIRADGDESQTTLQDDVELKRLKGISEEVVLINSEPRLLEALQQPD